MHSGGERVSSPTPFTQRVRPGTKLASAAQDVIIFVPCDAALCRLVLHGPQMENASHSMQAVHNYDGLVAHIWFMWTFLAMLCKEKQPLNQHFCQGKLTWPVAVGQTVTAETHGNRNQRLEQACRQLCNPQYYAACGMLQFDRKHKQPSTVLGTVHNQPSSQTSEMRDYNFYKSNLSFILTSTQKQTSSNQNSYILKISCESRKTNSETLAAFPQV